MVLHIIDYSLLDLSPFDLMFSNPIAGVLKEYIKKNIVSLDLEVISN